MAPGGRKRKHTQFEHDLRHDSPTASARPDLSLYIQAHEADLVRGPHAIAAADSLEVKRHEDDSKPMLEVGDGLIRWRGREESDGYAEPMEERTQLGNAPKTPGTAREDEGIWVDRYDARLLLDVLPTVLSGTNAAAPGPSSPGGWSDLPSDAEDMFFFSQEEVEDFAREKRRRIIEEDRQTRLRALRAEGEDDEGPSDPRESWGGSDEEPDEAQLELMRRTASHVLSSPNPAQLEMRILANHGADPRFAFLRGRWSRTWRLTKGKLRLEQEAEKRRSAKEAGKTGVALGGLAGYGDSDEDEDSDGADAGNSVNAKETPDSKPDVINDRSGGESQVEAVGPSGGDDVLRAARRARAREWAQKRRAAKALSPTVEDG
ncbi:hypothetical protein C8Q78DRAFT_993754 [Trametes maxima]|nr:hypothetical protein C8Q78DRAFT_993754 [Trametes maxima]